MCIQHQELFRDYGHRCLWELACCDDLLRCWLGPGGSQDSFPVSLQHDGICPGCDRARRRALNLDAEEDRRQRELYEARYRPARDEMLRQLRLRRRWEEQLRMERAWQKRDWEEKLRAEKELEERQLEEEQVEVKRQEGQRNETQLSAATCERVGMIRGANRQVKRQREEDQDQHGLPSENGTSTDQEEDERWRNKRRRMETPYDDEDDDDDDDEEEEEEDSVESET
ncbi:hypothetical protein BR93DRAFT_970978 [Coniochaeta sp. PMI_546]|nr:hypothetical protein BR93DRAFT_970978 [Coniochaeta sp. PMI_546]